MVQEEEGLAEHIHEDPRLAKIQAVRQKVGQELCHRDRMHMYERCLHESAGS
jgi:hypothetical protein